MLNLATARHDGLAEIIAGLTEGKSIADILVGVARYTEALRMAAEAEATGLKNSLIDLEAIKQRMKSGLILPGPATSSPGNLITPR